MARFPFRLYGKKRGDRRTGSQTLGNVGEALFFAFFLVLGTASLVWLLARWVLPEWQVVHGFAQTTSRVLGKEMDGQDGRKLLERSSDGVVSYRPNIHIAYQVNGQAYVAWTYGISEEYFSSREEAQGQLDQFVEGQEYPCWYNPASPETVVLVRGFKWWLWIVTLVPVSFIVIGGAGLIWNLFQWGKSAEHRSVAEIRVAALNPLQAGGDVAGLYPYVPHAANLTNSPGTTLAYRLPISTMPTWRLFALGVACVVWNGLVIAFLVLFATGRIAADPVWPFWLMQAVVVPAGWALVFLFVRELLRTSGVGPTLVEISDHPIFPGTQYEIFLSQSGKLSLRAMELSLVCDEEATYRQGTDTRTDHRRVYFERIWGRESFEIDQGLQFEVRCPLCLPAVAMHSFKGAFNEVQWKLIVRGEVLDWPSFERIFPIIVIPRPKDGSAP